MQEIHSGLSEYMCVLDGKDKAVDGNKWNFTSVSGIMDKEAWAQITLSLKGGWEHSKNFSSDFVHCMEGMPIFVTV